MNWKDPAIAARLEELWNAGHSCSVIARMMGEDVTRNAVIGAVRRADLPFRGYRPGGVVAKHSIGSTSRSMSQVLGGKIARKKVSNGKGKPFTLRDRVPPMTIIADPTPLPPPSADDKARVSFDELENHHCRWIVLTEAAGPYVKQFCGFQKKNGLPYCEEHARRAFAPPQVRSRPQLVPADSNVIVLRKREEVAA
jgi:GcrA cell cycle regulator